MDTLTAFVLAQLLVHKPPGKSPYSMEAMQECGLDAKMAACKIEPVCKIPAFWCAKPRWSASRAAWVRVETKITGLHRYKHFAERVVHQTRYLTKCVGKDGVAVEDCWRAPWWRGSQDLSLVLATLGIFEAGMAEGPMYGHPPMGRGADGEVCMLGIMPQYAPKYASWLPKEERERLAKAPYKEIEAWAMRDLHGPENLDRCIEISIREIVDWRTLCKTDYGMFSGYASGKCDSGAKTIEMRRSLLNKMRRTRAKLPKWATEELDG